MAMNMPAMVRGCLDKFKALREPEDYDGAEADTYSIKNELDRYKIWVGNLAAHRPMGKRSLEYRLRDSNDLRSQVLELLNDLSRALDCYANPPASRGDESSASDSEDELLDFEYDDLAIQPPNSLQDIHETINLLYQFSATLRNPAGHNRIQAGVTSMRPYYSEIYVNLVRDKFPDAAQYLIERLGGAISSRRQYFKYREEHTSKMNAGLEDLDDGRTTTIASSVPKAVEYVTDIEETETNYSMTSYAPTESETSKLRPPPLPKAGSDGDPFECPLCYSMIQVSGETMWKQHVFEDLAPYVCTREDCRLGNKLYTRRRDWQRHQTHMHDRIWVCPLGCGSEYSSSDDVNSHLAQKHGHTNQEGRSTRRGDVSSCRTDAPFDLQCPLCRKVNASTNLWFRHVGKHLEQLALQAIDSHKLATESDDEAVSGPEMDRISEEDLVSYGSSNDDILANVPILNEEVAPRPDAVAVSTEEQQRHTPAQDPGAYAKDPYSLLEMEDPQAEGSRRGIPGSGYGGSVHRSRSLDYGPVRTKWKKNDLHTRSGPVESSLGVPYRDFARGLPYQDRARGRLEDEPAEELAAIADERRHLEAQREAELRELSRRLEEDRIKAQARLNALDNERNLRDAQDKKEADEKRWKDEYERKKREAADKAKADEQTLEDRLERETKEKDEAAAYKAFKQKEQDQREAEMAFQAEMRERLQALGYTDQTIDIMVDEEKSKNFKSTVEGQSSRADIYQAPRAPVYPKVHRDYLAIETLKYYDLPWQYDSGDPDYIIIMRDMEKRETDLLFEHTSRLRSGKILLEPKKKSEKPMVMYRRRSRSRSGRPVEDEVLRKK